MQIPLKAIGLSGVHAAIGIRVIGATDRSGQRLEAEVVAGVLRIVSNASPPAGSPLAGDADGDGTVTACDAMVAAKMAGRVVPSRLAADTDADGYVTAEDARLILKLVAGTQEVRRD